MRKSAPADTGLRTGRFEQRLDTHGTRPELAHAAGLARVRVAYGMACDVDLGDRSLRVDLPHEAGGTGSGPHPDQLMRASLGACLAMSYRRCSLALGIAVSGVELDLCCEYDAYSQSEWQRDAALGWQRLHVRSTLCSDAPEADLLRLVETAHRHSPMLANLSPDVERRFELQIRPVR